MLVTEHQPKLLPSELSGLTIMQQPASYPRPRRPILFFKHFLLPWLKLRYAMWTMKVNKVIAVDIKGLLLADAFTNISIDYISFEILSAEEITDALYQKMKVREISILKTGISSLLIQDKYRAELFNDANPGNKVNTVFHLPVAPVVKKKPEPKSPHHPARLIYSGSLWEWSGIGEVIDTLSERSSFVLTIHHRFPEWSKSATVLYIKECIQKGMPMELHNHGYEPEPYLNYLADFDIGLVTYKPDASTGMYNGKNFEIIGYSSGKFATFLALGIPVIVTQSSSYNDLIKNYHFGYVLNDISEIQNGVDHILESYAYHSAEARRLYEEVLAPKTYIDPYIDHLKSA